MKILPNSSTPIYKQISDSLRDDILNGTLKEGEYLPSIRGLAKDLKISVITTMKAYEELSEQGLVTAIQGKGYVVNARNSEMLREQQQRLVEDSLLAAISSARTAGITSDELKELLNTLLEADL
ncbi:MAG: GntR family transcriptional regulator [Oscillospiraceae bacterium]|nr:GntR family transcriptional regulator [Oscillospiraceae bacterium]